MALATVVSQKDGAIIPDILVSHTVWLLLLRYFHTAKFTDAHFVNACSIVRTKLRANNTSMSEERFVTWLT